MRKIIILLTLLFYLVLFVLPQNVSCSSTSVERHVKDFYAWYVSKSIEDKLPLDDDSIYKYVNHCTVNNVRLYSIKNYFDADYFTKSQDIWKEWLEALVVHGVTRIDETTSIVPISFKLAAYSQKHLVVFVSRQKEGLRITKVVDIANFYE